MKEIRRRKNSGNRNLFPPEKLYFSVVWISSSTPFNAETIKKNCTILIRFIKVSFIQLPFEFSPSPFLQFSCFLLLLHVCLYFFFRLTLFNFKWKARKYASNAWKKPCLLGFRHFFFLALPLCFMCCVCMYMCMCIFILMLMCIYVLGINDSVFVVNIGFSVIVRIVFNFSLLLGFIKMCCLSVWLFAYAFACVCLNVYIYVCVFFLNSIHFAIHLNDAAALVSAFAFINFRLVKSEKRREEKKNFKMTFTHGFGCCNKAMKHRQQQQQI